jgi:nicotinamidase-related amidase
VSGAGDVTARTTAFVLVGFQNEIFGDGGGLRDFVEATAAFDDALERTVRLVRSLPGDTPLVVSTPLSFSDDYAELVEPVGVLAAIRDRGLFRAGTPAVDTVDALTEFDGRVVDVPGRRGLDAFADTDLDRLLRHARVRDVVLAGAMTSLCVAATARAAADLGYRVSVLADCTAASSEVEHRLFCDVVLPMFAEVVESTDVLRALTSEER